MDVHNFVRRAFVVGVGEDDEGAATWAGEDEEAYHRDGVAAAAAYTWRMGPSEVEQVCPSLWKRGPSFPVDVAIGAWKEEGNRMNPRGSRHLWQTLNPNPPP